PLSIFIYEYVCFTATSEWLIMSHPCTCEFCSLIFRPIDQFVLDLSIFFFLFFLFFFFFFFFFSSRRRHTRSKRDWSSDVCSSDLLVEDVPWVVLNTILLQKFQKFLAKISALVMHFLLRDVFQRLLKV